MEKTKNLISLSELAKIVEINKSKLSYYAALGMFWPIQIVGGMQIFDKDETMKSLKLIEKKQKQGKSLKEIKEELNG